MEQRTQSLKALTVFLRSAQAVQEVIKQDTIKYGVNPTEFGVLEFLAHKGDQPIQLIGRKILLASSSITYVVDRLEKKGFVQRIPSPKDRRVIYASITDAGLNLIERHFPHHEKKISEIFDVLSDEELKEVTKLLKKIGLHAESIQ